MTGIYVPPRELLTAQAMSKLGGTLSTTVTGSTSANTWPASWTQIQSSTDYPMDWIQIDTNQINSNALGAHIMAFQLATGAASSEVELTPPIILDAPFTFRSGKQFSMPIPHVPAGTRISARVRSDAASGSGPSVRIHGHGSSIQISPWQQGLYSYGETIDGSNTAGTTIDPGSSANTKGSWTQLVGSSDQETKWLVVNVAAGNNAMSNAVWAMDLAIGTVSNKYIIIEDINFASRAAEDFIYPNVFHYKRHIPRARQLFARAQCSVTDATDRVFDVQVLAGG